MSSLRALIYIILTLLASPFFVLGFVARSVFLIIVSGVLVGWETQRKFMDRV